MLKLNTKLNRVGRGKYRIVYKIAIMNGKEKKKKKTTYREVGDDQNLVPKNVELSLIYLYFKCETNCRHSERTYIVSSRFFIFLRPLNSSRKREREREKKKKKNIQSSLSNLLSVKSYDTKGKIDDLFFSWT